MTVNIVEHKDVEIPEYIPPGEFLQLLKWLKYNKNYKWTTISNIVSGLVAHKRDKRTMNYARNVWADYCNRNTSIPIREPEDLADELVFAMFPWYGPCVLRAIQTFYREINKLGYDNDWQKFIDESGDLLTLKQIFKSHMSWVFATSLRAWYLNGREPDYDPNIYGRWYVERGDDIM